MPTDTELQVFTTGNANVAAFTAATQHANAQANAAQVAAGNATSAVAGLDASVTAKVQPAITAATTALVTAQAFSGIQLDFRSTTDAFPRNPTPTELSAAGDIQGIRTNTLGQQQPIKWNRSSGAWNDYGLPLADAVALAQTDTKATLATTTLAVILLGLCGGGVQSDGQWRLT
jgi:hypothetical protein